MCMSIFLAYIQNILQNNAAQVFVALTVNEALSVLMEVVTPCYCTLRSTPLQSMC